MQLLYSMTGFAVLAASLLLVSAGSAEQKAKPPAGKPLLTMYGANSKITKKKLLRVTSAKQWEALWAEHKLGSPIPKKLPDGFEYVELDFDKVMVIAVFGGGCCTGYTVDSIMNTKTRITVRVKAHTYQTGFIRPERCDSQVSETQAWGIFVLPRSDKEVLLEQDVRTLLADPPRWKPWKTLPAIKARKKP